MGQSKLTALKDGLGRVNLMEMTENEFSSIIIGMVMKVQLMVCNLCVLSVNPLRPLRFGLVIKASCFVSL